MATATRTDVHREGVLVPADYRFVDVLDLYAGTNKDDVAAKVSAAEVPTAWTHFVTKMVSRVKRYRKHAIGDRPSLAQCNICGAHIRYAVVWSYFPEGVFEGFITTGLDCAESMGSAQLSEVAEKAGALKEFVAGCRRAAKEAEAAAKSVPSEAATRWAAIAEKRRLWIVASVEHRLVANYLHRLSTDHADAHCDNCFFCDVTRQLVEEGFLSERQVGAVLKAEERHARSGVDPAPKVAIPSGVATVSGEVASVKDRSGLKMLIKCPGYRVWAPVPAELRDEVRPGQSIQLTAELSPSATDSTFLFGSDLRDVELVR